MTTNTSQMPVWANGINLHTLASNVDLRTGFGSMAGMRGSSEVVPGRQGSLYVPGKRRDEGVAVLSMWATDDDEDGNSLADAYGTYRLNIDKLMRLFDTSQKQVFIEEATAQIDPLVGQSATNLNVNPAMRGVGGAVTVLQNKIPNPSWRTTAGTVETRRNVLTNPMGPTSNAITNWTPSRATGTNPGGYGTFTLNDATVSGLAQRINSPSIGYYPAAAGDWWTLTADVRSSTPSATMAVNIVFYDSGGTLLTSTISAYTAVQSVAWTTLTISAQAPANTASAYLQIGYGPTFARSIGDTFDVRNILFEKSDSNLGYFDGATAAANGLTYSWTGTALLSASIATGPDFAAISSPFTYYPYGSATAVTGWQSASGIYRMLMKLAQGTGALFGFSQVNQSPVPGTAGKYYSARVKARQIGGSGSVSLTVTTNAYDSSGVLVSQMGLTTTTLIASGDWVDILIPSTIAPTNTSTIRFITKAGAAMPSGTVLEFKEAIIIESANTPYDVEGYFDGSSANVAIRTNLATNPRAVNAAGFSSNNSTITVTSFVSGIVGHPLGITTGARSDPASGQYNVGNTLMSVYNIDFMGSVFSNRGVGCWVWSSCDATVQMYMSNNLAGTTQTVTIPANTWTWCTVGAIGTGYSLLIVRKNVGNVTADDYCIATGVMAEAGVVPADFFDGASTSYQSKGYAWNGAAYGSSSVQYLTGLTPAWAGTANASVSNANALPITGYTTSPNYVYQGGPDGQGGYWGEIKGSPYMYTAPVSANVGEYYAAVATVHGKPGSTLRFVIHDGHSYITSYDTLGNDSYLTIPASGTMTMYAYSKIPTRGTQPRAYLYQSGAYAGWAGWARVVIQKVSGPNMLPQGYFDGNGAYAPGYRAFWNGTPDASTSTQTVRTRQANCEVRTVITPQMQARYWSTFTVELILNDTFWSDAADTEFISTVGTGAPGTYTLNGFTAATAPMEDVWVVVDGPATNPRVTDVATGHYVQYTGTISNTQQWVVNTSTWESVIGNNLNYSTAGGSSVVANTSAVGSYAPRYFGLTPNASGPQVTFSCTAASTTTRLRIKGRQKFH